MRTMRLLACLSLSVCSAGAVFAQEPSVTSPQGNRPALEQQLRMRMAEVLRKRLNLTDAQMTQLQQVNGKYAPQIAALATQERQTRQQLRTQITAPTPDQAQVSQLIDALLRFQRQRVDLVDAEQKDLGGFLTPVQRAQYMALQAQLKRRADQLRRSVATRRAGGGRNRAQPPIRR
jgi:Spy/CpxP family protein refolding chaperone